MIIKLWIKDIEYDYGSVTTSIHATEAEARGDKDSYVSNNGIPVDIYGMDFDITNCEVVEE